MKNQTFRFGHMGDLVTSVLLEDENRDNIFKIVDPGKIFNSSYL